MVKKKLQGHQEELAQRFKETAVELAPEADLAGSPIREFGVADPAPRERKDEMIWYVAYSLLPVPGARTDQGERIERFAHEAAAKRYARQIATDPKLSIRAGTLPGCTPAMQIDATKIHAWLDPSKDP